MASSIVAANSSGERQAKQGKMAEACDQTNELCKWISCCASRFQLLPMYAAAHNRDDARQWALAGALVENNSLVRVIAGERQGKRADGRLGGKEEKGIILAALARRL